MMKALKYIALAAAVIVGMASCADPGNVHFKGIEDASMGGLQTVQITAHIDNQSHCNINLLHGQVTLFDRGNVVAKVVLSEKVKIPRRTDGSVAVPLTLVIPNPFALLALPGRLKNGGNDLTVSGEMTVRGGLARKTYRIDPTPLPQLLSRFGIAPDALTNYLKL